MISLHIASVGYSRRHDHGAGMQTSPGLGPKTLAVVSVYCRERFLKLIQHDIFYRSKRSLRYVR